MIIGIMYLNFFYPFIILVRVFNNRLTVSEFFLCDAKNAWDYYFCILLVFDCNSVGILRRKLPLITRFPTGYHKYNQ
jgi:hypothetical protein